MGWVLNIRNSAVSEDLEGGQGAYDFTPVCLFVGWSVLSAGLHKTTEQFSVKLGWRMGLSPEETPY